MSYKKRCNNCNQRNGCYRLALGTDEYPGAITGYVNQIAKRDLCLNNEHCLWKHNRVKMEQGSVPNFRDIMERRDDMEWLEKRRYQIRAKVLDEALRLEQGEVAFLVKDRATGHYKVTPVKGITQEELYALYANILSGLHKQLKRAKKKDSKKR